MIKDIHSTTTLHNGVKMPWFGLGIYKIEEGEELISTVHTALELGYRSFDTASLYQNERGLGIAIKAASISREELFITSKVWNTDQGYESTLTAFDESLERLGLDYLDLYLIHWPVPNLYKDTWKALEKLYQEGKVRAIGVSNFHIHHLQDVMNIGTIKPMVNQVEYHPKLSQEKLRFFCQQENIQLEAWSPLMRGRLQGEPTLMKIAAKYGKTIAQVILRWDLQNGVITIPKTTKKERLIENANIFDFFLTPEDMEQINSLNENLRTGKDPDHFGY
ncbi:aldo/keto reductase [Shimazuella sp. AN120528]|uniref:aldo/keto reductase n=1 Tax=Shimazuella soli TaxID=1892854 RepID=UPI001F0F9A9B|nr:aldo/keto reductase [Shimazuella soli]MCH5585588.1 aldo/keto reductase [Shimazuella soli]